jgi:ABC-type phosphate transport system substrate-binding protein
MIKTRWYQVKLFCAIVILGGILPAGFIPQAEAANVVVIVNKARAASEITLKDLKKIYQGNKNSWKEGGAIHFYLPPSGSPAMSALLKNVLHVASEDELNKFYITAVFQQNIVSVPQGAASDVESVQRVSFDPDGIALVEESSIPEGALVVKKTIEGINN